MKKATERTRYDAATGTVIVECTEPGGGTLDMQINVDAAEAIVQAFNEAKPEPPLGLDDSGVYRVSDFKLTPAGGGLILDLWVADGRKARFILPASMRSEGEIDTLSTNLRRLLMPRQLAYSRH
jgi:hypothetical protein